MSSPLFAALAQLVATFRAPTVEDDRVAALGGLAALAGVDALDLRIPRRPGSWHPPPDPTSADPRPSATAALEQVLQQHRVERLVIRRGASARELAQFAGLLARTDRDAEGGLAAASLVGGLDALGIWSIHVDTGPVDASGDDVLAPELRAAVDAVVDAVEPASITAAYAAVAAGVAAVGARLAPHAAAAHIVQTLTALVRLDRAPATVHATVHATGFASLLDAQLEPVLDAVVAGAGPDAWDVVRRAPDRAVPLLLQRLSTAESMEQRRRCFHAILETGAGVDAFFEALGDARWYVVRNVALLLGELRDPAAVRPLARALQRSSDTRVRDAAAQALDRIDTAAAVHALLGALRDASPTVRRIAARALPRTAGHRVPLSVAFVTDRLRGETDAEVAEALVSVLPELAWVDASAALVMLACEPDGAPIARTIATAAWRALRALSPDTLLPTLRGLARGADARVGGAAARVARALVAERAATGAPTGG